MPEIPQKIYCPGCNDSHEIETQPSEWGWFAECARCGSKLEEIGAWNRWITIEGRDTVLYIPILSENYEPAELAVVIIEGTLSEQQPSPKMWHWGAYGRD